MSSFSSRVTSWPRSAAVTAAYMPDTPPPTTTTLRLPRGLGALRQRSSRWDQGLTAQCHSSGMGLVSGSEARGLKQEQRRQGAMVSSRPVRALFTNSGSANCCRPMATKSHWPEARAASIWSGLLKPPTATTGTRTWALMAPARSRLHPCLSNMEEKALVFTWSWYTPEVTWMRST